MSNCICKTESINPHGVKNPYIFTYVDNNCPIHGSKPKEEQTEGDLLEELEKYYWGHDV